MLDTSRPEVLRNVLLVDAGACLASGALMSLGAGTLARLTSIPEPLLFYAGLALVPVALVMAVVATRMLSAAPVWLIVVGNGLWVAGSVWLLLSAISPNAIGTLYIAAQALVVSALTCLEARGAAALADQGRRLAAQPEG